MTAVLIAGLVLVLSAGCSPEDLGEAEKPVSEGVTASSFALACINENGWDRALDSQGGINSEGIPAEQYEQYSADMDACLESMGTRFELDRDDAPALYEAELDTVECLDGEGYRVESVPSKQAYIDSWAEQWSAYRGLRGKVDAKEWERLNTACPQAGSRFNGVDFNPIEAS